MSAMERPSASRPDPVSGDELVEAYADYFGAICIDPEQLPGQDLLSTVHESAGRIVKSLGAFASGAHAAAVAYEDYYLERYSATGMRMPPADAVALRRQKADVILRAPIQACCFADLGSVDRSYIVSAAASFYQSPGYVETVVEQARTTMRARCPRGEVIRGLDHKGIDRVTKAALVSIGLQKPSKMWAALASLRFTS